MSREESETSNSGDSPCWRSVQIGAAMPPPIFFDSSEHLGEGLLPVSAG